MDGLKNKIKSEVIPNLYQFAHIISGELKAASLVEDYFVFLRTKIGPVSNRQLTRIIGASEFTKKAFQKISELGKNYETPFNIQAGAFWQLSASQRCILFLKYRKHFILNDIAFVLHLNHEDILQGLLHGLRSIQKQSQASSQLEKQSFSLR